VLYTTSEPLRFYFWNNFGIKNSIFCDRAPCSSLKADRWLGGACRGCNIFRRSRVVLPCRTNITKVLLRPPWCYHQLPEWCDGDHLWCWLKMINGVMSRSDTSSRRSQWADVRVPQNIGRLSDIGSGKRTKSFLSLLTRTRYLYYKSQSYRLEYRCWTAVRQSNDLTQAEWSIKMMSGRTTHIFIQFIRGVATG
jgi:hypothetical protein